MLASIVADFFKFKVVQSIIVLACWPPEDQLVLIRQLSQSGVSATFICIPSALKNIHKYQVQGVLHLDQHDGLLEKVNPDHFSHHYNWLLVGKGLPDIINNVRYDAEMTFLRLDKNEIGNSNFDVNRTQSKNLEDIYIHPIEGASLHPWAHWTEATGLVVTEDQAKYKRKKNLKGYPLRIASPVGHYSEDFYNGSYTEYLLDETLKEVDAAIRCGFGASMLVIDAMNATDEVTTVLFWATAGHNSSMLEKIKSGEADLTGGIMRLMPSRMDYMDYIMPIWPFSVGFSYLAERESSSNMFVEPFTAGVWCCCLSIGIILAAALRVSSRSLEEKDSSSYTVLATFLQQDASAVPHGIAGRWTFIVLSICSMLVHAYYTSAIVSALMSSGRSGPNSLRALADSKYTIASEDIDYMRLLMFDVQTSWDDLEYLKKKKMTTSFYQTKERGVELLQEGTAFHTEYNELFPLFNKLTDDQVCKLQYIDTIPKVMTWIATTRSGQWTSTMRPVSSWIQEVGLAKRLQSTLLCLQPPCRSALLAERVNLGDIAPLLGLTVAGAILSLILLGIEILFAEWKKKRQKITIISEVE